MVRRANRKKRGWQTREERKILLVATEGNNKTEKNYFTEFNRTQNRYHIVFAEGNNTDPAKVVTDAAVSSENRGLELTHGDKAYAVVDTDFGKEKQIQEARRLAEKYRVDLLLSNPCFEIWFLLHFRYSTRGYSSNSEVLDEIKNRWSDYEKNMESFSSITDRTEIAIENAMQLEKYHEKNNEKVVIERCNPSTNVYKLVELINQERGKMN